MTDQSKVPVQPPQERRGEEEEAGTDQSQPRVGGHLGYQEKTEGPLQCEAEQHPESMVLKRAGRGSAERFERQSEQRNDVGEEDRISDFQSEIGVGAGGHEPRGVPEERPAEIVLRQIARAHPRDVGRIEDIGADHDRKAENTAKRSECRLQRPRASRVSGSGIAVRSHPIEYPRAGECPSICPGVGGAVFALLTCSAFTPRSHKSISPDST